MDLVKVVDDKVKDDVKDNNALARSAIVRKHCEFLMEDSLKVRKSYFCKEQTGYFHKKINSNPL